MRHRTSPGSSGVAALGAAGFLLLSSLQPVRAATWSHDFGGAQNYRPSAIHQTADGGFQLFGDTALPHAGLVSEPSGPDHAFWTIRIDANGNLLGQAIYPDGGDSLEPGAAPRADGGWMLAGTRSDHVTGHLDGFLLAIDAVGSSVFAETLGSNDPVEIRSIAPAADGTFVMGGTMGSIERSAVEMWVVKVAVSGAIVWSHRYSAHPSEMPGPRRPEEAIAVEPTPDGGVLVGGQVDNADPRSRYAPIPFPIDLSIQKIDGNGQVLWSRTYGGAATEYMVDLKRSADGGILVLGNSVSFSSSFAPWVLKLDGSGNVLWQEILTAQGPYLTTGLTFAPTSDGGAAVLVGRSQGTAIVRLGPLGEVLWSRTSSSLEPAEAMTRASNGDFLVSLIVLQTSPRYNARVIRTQDDGLLSYCSGLDPDVPIGRVATTAASANRKVVRHAFAPSVSSVPVVVGIPSADLGPVCQ